MGGVEGVLRVDRRGDEQAINRVKTRLCQVPAILAAKTYGTSDRMTLVHFRLRRAALLASLNDFDFSTHLGRL